MSRNNSFSDKQRYIISPDLKAAVDTATFLGIPLLLTGEPGTGKTSLAHYLSNEVFDANLLIFNTKTSSKAKDLLYKYNALAHFRSAGHRSSNPYEYITFTGLGKAILDSNQHRTVVLVDEIDKAPRDFPNDVLFEFDELAFQVEEASIEETKSWAKSSKSSPNIDDQGFFRFNGPPQKKPILILTSNSEKNLPDAFLRRCAYFHINFPDRNQLLEIVHSKVSFSENFSRKMVEHAVDHFLEIRDIGLRKNPATAELLAWIHLLREHNLDVKKGLSGTDDSIRRQIVQTYTVLSKNYEDRQRLLSEFDR